MIFRLKRNLTVIPAVLAALASLALLAGCKGNTTSAAGLEKHVGPPPAVEANFTPVNPSAANPASEAAWSRAQWYLLAAPADTNRTTSPVRAAMLYDAANVYVAFASDTVPPPSAPISQDVVSVFLDPTATQDGTDLVHVIVDAAGHCSCDWIRSETPAQPKPDGSPDYGHPMERIPNVKVPGLQATLSRGGSTWTTVVTIPLKTLPLPFRVNAKIGDHWKINLLRTVTMVDTGTGVQQLQANLSPVYVGAQPAAPYRMALLTLGPTR